jgi:hypothetical protein
MNEPRRGGSHKGLLLLIPAAVIIAKGASRRRAMWESGPGPAGFAGQGHGHPYRFGGRGGRVDENGNFRLPPKIESMLESWHERAHAADAAAESTTV